jgi:hypothetical protein
MNVLVGFLFCCNEHQVQCQEFPAQAQQPMTKMTLVLRPPLLH